MARPDKDGYETRHWMRPDLLKPSSRLARNLRTLIILLVIAGLAAAVVFLGDKPLALAAVVVVTLLCCVSLWIPGMKRRDRRKPDPDPIRD